jgi:hypothetical protein
MLACPKYSLHEAQMHPVFKDFDRADYRVRRSAPRRSSVLYEARCSLLTLAVWFAFSIVAPSDSGSGK